MHDVLQELTDDNPEASGAAAARARSRFQERLTEVLGRLAERGTALAPWEEEDMLGALGAASLSEYELAAAFVEAADQPAARPAPARNVRRPALTAVALQRRFENVLGRSH
jgi:hypothetical protein